MQAADTQPGDTRPQHSHQAGTAAGELGATRPHAAIGGPALSGAGSSGATHPQHITRPSRPASSSATQPVRPKELPQSPPAARTKRQPGGLGEQVYRLNPFSLGDGLFLAAAGLMAGFPLAYALQLSSSAYAQYGPAAAQAWSRPWFLLAALSAAAFFLLFLLRGLRSLPWVAISPRGLRVKLGLQPPRFLAWNDLAGLALDFDQERFFGLPLSERRRAVLYPHQGRPVRLSGRRPEFDALIRGIQRSLYPRLQPVLFHRFAAGEWLVFGPLSVHTSSGLRLKGRSLPWASMARVSVRAGWLEIEPVQGPGLRVPVAHLPNLEILMQILLEGVNT